MQYVFLEYSIDCAHWLPRVPPGHKCGAMHGHRYDIRIEVAGGIDDMGWIMDYAEIKLHADPVICSLDHQTLNHLPGLDNPTCENIVIWIRERLAIPGLVAIEVRETARAGAGWRIDGQH